MKKNVIILVLVLVFIGILLLMDLPGYNKFTFLGNEIKKYKNLLEEREEFIAKVNQLKEVYESRESEIKKAYYSLPSEKDIPGLIVQFEAMASENGLVLEKLDFFEKKEKKAAVTEEGGEAAPLSETTPKKVYKVLSVILSATGSYPSFTNFLGALEFNIRLMDIKSIGFSSEKLKEEGLFTFNLELEVYYQ